MTGGLGTRLRPLTNKTPKPMLKVGDKPLLESIILGFKKYGFT
jgi:NDP-sugar pyrophosphorylase family protein